MRDESGKEEGLTPDQQKLLMGQIAALQDALAVVVMSLPGEEQLSLRASFHQMRDDPRATATIPTSYRAAARVARYHTFDRLMRALVDHPENDNEG